jgi:hypothetical protein
MRNKSGIPNQLEYPPNVYHEEFHLYRNEVIATNGENHTYHTGAYLAEGLLFLKLVQIK